MLNVTRPGENYVGGAKERKDVQGQHVIGQWFGVADDTFGEVTFVKAHPPSLRRPPHTDPAVMCDSLTTCTMRPRTVHHRRSTQTLDTMQLTWKLSRSELLTF